MGLFGKRTAAGITQYELDRKHLHSRLRAAFPHGSTGDLKMGALDTALAVAMDPDTNTPLSQRVVQKDEFETIVSKLEEYRVITSAEAEKLRSTAEEDLND
jgi:riboflavin biosynthesis pyrimidine reductase